MDTVNDLPLSFFSEIEPFSDFEGVTDIQNYQTLPVGWALVVGDIVDSTGAIAAGRYKAVNMAGASIISAVLNALDKQDLPFAFGGDGAMVAIPPSAVSAARDAVAAVRTWVREEMDMDMRAAVVPIEEIRAAGLDVRVGRFQVSEEVSYAMFAGGGASWAEEQMKQGRFQVGPAPPSTRPDLTGLSCRWSPIPSRRGEIVSIIAVQEPGGDVAAFQRLIAEIVAVAAGGGRGGHPIPVEGPRAALSLAGVEWEAKALAPPAKRWGARLRLLVMGILAFVLFNLKMKFGRFDTNLYRREVAENSDFRKFDDGLKMTIDVDAEGLRKIEALLQQGAQSGVCRYGLHRQDAALMTCFVLSPLSHDHMHFIDGASGGYALAARQLKHDPAGLTVVTP